MNNKIAEALAAAIQEKIGSGKVHILGMGNSSCADCDTSEATEPKINIEASTHISVGHVNTLDEMSVIAGKLNGISLDCRLTSLSKLSTAVGDLSASVVGGDDSEEEFADEVADVLIGTFTVAAHHSVDPVELRMALQRRLSSHANAGVKAAFNEMMADRGFGQL